MPVKTTTHWVVGTDYRDVVEVNANGPSGLAISDGQVTIYFGCELAADVAEAIRLAAETCIPATEEIPF